MNDNFYNIQGKVALITGSGRGLGYTFAEGLAEAGCKVVLNGRNKETLEEAQKTLSNKGFEVFANAFDITDSKEVYKNIKEIQLLPILPPKEA